MLEKYYFNQSDHTDLNVYRCGIEECRPGYTWGPGIRDHFIVHFIIKGSGTFFNGKTTYSLKKGDGFVIFPGSLVTYSADKYSPWTYSWVGFHGLKAESLLTKSGLSKASPSFTYSSDDKLENCLNSMLSDARLNTPSELMLLGHLYIFLSLLIQNSRNITPQASKFGSQEKYVRRAIEFISKNYSGKVSIRDIASNMAINRSYLYLVFMKHMNISPQDFLIRYRLERALELMRNPALSIGDIARSVGYDDTLRFSKIFKKEKGLSPSHFRKQMAFLPLSEPSKSHSPDS